MRLARHSNLLLTVLSLLALCYGCGIRSGLFVGDAGVDSGADEGEGEAGSGGSNGDAAAPELLCGNGVIDEREQCDGDNLGNETCLTLGEGDGELRCGPACLFDVSMCAPRYPMPTNPGGYGDGTAAPVAPPAFPFPFDGGTGDAGGALNDLINSFLDGGTIDGGQAGGGLFGGTFGGGNQGGGNTGAQGG